MERAACVLIVAAACGARGERDPAPRDTAAPSPAPSSATAVPADPATPAPAVVERWACDRAAHPLVDFHTARLELRDDGTFALHHTHTQPSHGWSTWLEGTWTRDGDARILAPTAALRRRWIGDGHRHQHGEDVPYEQWEEPVAAAPWRLEAAGDPPALRLGELRTRVVRVDPGAAPPPCDEGAPPHGRRPP